MSVAVFVFSVYEKLTSLRLITRLSSLYSGRKRPPPEFGPPGNRDEGQRKKGRFEGGGGGDGDPASAPPATLRVLVRQQDAGAIIGKVGLDGLVHVVQCMYMYIYMYMAAVHVMTLWRCNCH